MRPRPPWQAVNLTVPSGMWSWLCGGPRPGSIRNVRAGTLDDTSWLRPTVHFWTGSKQPWVALPEGAQSFETQPADMQGFLYSSAETR
jgi:hypothetical protein